MEYKSWKRFDIIDTLGRKDLWYIQVYKRDKEWDLIKHHFATGKYGNRAIESV